MPRPIRFEIQADDPLRAIAFYTAVFGWEFKRLRGPLPYWLITTGPSSEPGIDGGLHARVGPPPQPDQAVTAFLCTIDVPSLDATVALVARHGGFVLSPKIPVPAAGWLAYARDSEGNILGLMEADPTVPEPRIPNYPEP